MKRLVGSILAGILGAGLVAWFMVNRYEFEMVPDGRCLVCLEQLPTNEKDLCEGCQEEQNAD